MQFRMKISWIAFKKKMTIVELFCSAILKSYNEMVQEGIIIEDKETQESDKLLLQHLQNGLNFAQILNFIIRYNVPKLEDCAMKDELIQMIKEQNEAKVKKDLAKCCKIQFTVRKNGQMKTITIDENCNEALVDQIKKFIHKGQCQDIFKDTVIYGKNGAKLRLYEKKSDRKFIQEKRVRTDLVQVLRNLQLIISLKCVNGIVYVKTLMLKIQQARRLFV